MSAITHYCSINVGMTKAKVRYDVNDNFYGSIQFEAIVDIRPDDESKVFLDSCAILNGKTLDDIAVWLEDAAQTIRTHLNNKAMNGQMALIPGGKK